MDFEPVVTFPLVKFGMFKTQSIVILFYLQVSILQKPNRNITRGLERQHYLYFFSFYNFFDNFRIQFRICIEYPLKAPVHARI